MSEMGGSYDPGPWQGWDYSAARKSHVDITAGRGYAKPAAPIPASSSANHKPALHAEEVPKNLKTEAISPLAIIVDGTGSMGVFPETIFKKLPLLDDGVKDYLEGCEISYAMIGDAACDQYPLQIQSFGTGKQMVKALNKLVIEGGGGGNQVESYDLAAAYYAHNVEMPKAVRPILIFICDEGVYPNIDRAWAKKFANVDLEKAQSATSLFDQLKTKYSVYCIRKHYENAGPALDGDKLIGSNFHIHQQWEKLLGADQVVILNDPARVVDVILGLLAHETGKMDFFKKEITFRQKPEQVKTVMKTMASLAKEKDKEKDKAKSIKSIIRPDSGLGGPSQGSKSLI